MKKLLILLFCASIAGAQTFQVGDTVKVIPTVSCVNVRSQLTTTIPPLKCEPAGTLGVIRSAATMWGSYAYYTVAYADGITGWSAGIYLAKVANAPVVLPPSGSLSVTPITNGFATLSFTASGDTSAVFSGMSPAPYSGTITVPVSAPTSFTMTLLGEGGTSSYTVSTSNGVPIPAIDTVAIALRAFNLGYNTGLVDGIAIGKSAVGLDSVKVHLSNGKVIIR